LFIPYCVQQQQAGKAADKRPAADFRHRSCRRPLLSSDAAFGTVHSSYTRLSPGAQPPAHATPPHSAAVTPTFRHFHSPRLRRHTAVLQPLIFAPNEYASQPSIIDAVQPGYVLSTFRQPASSKVQPAAAASAGLAAAAAAPFSPLPPLPRQQASESARLLNGGAARSRSAANHQLRHIITPVCH